LILLFKGGKVVRFFLTRKRKRRSRRKRRRRRGRRRRSKSKEERYDFAGGEEANFCRFKMEGGRFPLRVS
jgi:hypothetical protein